MKLLMLLDLLVLDLEQDMLLMDKLVNQQHRLGLLNPHNLGLGDQRTFQLLSQLHQRLLLLLMLKLGKLQVLRVFQRNQPLTLLVLMGIGMSQ